MAGNADEREFAVVAYREDDTWQVGRLPDRLAGDLDGFLKALRQQPADDVCLGLIDVADDFFVIARVAGENPRLLLSDVTAADEYDFARAVLDRLGIVPPSEEEFDDVYPAGDLSIVADLGMDEMELGALLADDELYADDMLFSIARRLGFGGALADTVGEAVH